MRPSLERPASRLAAAFAELGEVLKLSLPIIVTMTSHTLMQSVDAWMLGQYGRLELAAVGPAGLVYFSFAAAILGVMSCNNTFVAQSLGAGRARECASYTLHAVAVALAAQWIMFPLMLWAPNLFALLGHAPAVAGREVIYFRVRALQLAGTGMTAALSSFFQATDRPHVPMFTGIAANVFNIVGDWLLIFGEFGLPEWGIFGAGLATTLATYFEVLLLVAVFLSPRVHAVFETRRWGRFEFRKARRLLRIGLWTGLNFGLDIASWTVFIAWVVGRLGTDVLAGHNAAAQIMHLALMPAIGLNIGVTALVGRYIGMKDIAGAKRRGYLGMGCAAAYMTLMSALFVLLRSPLIGLFSRDPAVLAAGTTILCYMALYQFADAVTILATGSLRGAGDTRFPALVMLSIAWFLFIPAAVVLGRADLYGIHGAWLSAAGYSWLLALILFLRFASEGWRKINIFE